MGLPYESKDVAKNSEPRSLQTGGQELGPGSFATHKFTPTPCRGHSCEPHAVDLPLQGSLVPVAPDKRGHFKMATQHRLQIQVPSPFFSNLRSEV